MKRKLSAVLGGLAIGALALTGCAPAANGGGDDAGEGSGELEGGVYYLAADNTIVRFENFDRPAFIESMGELAPDMEVDFLNAGGRVQQQLDQVQGAIAEDAKAIVLVSVDPNQAAGALAAADSAGIPVICNSHDCLGGPAYAYITAEFVDIGEVQGQILADAAEEHYEQTGEALRVANIYGDPSAPFYVEILEGKDPIVEEAIDAGYIDEVCQEDALEWQPSNAQRAMENCLTRVDNEVDAIFVMNDDYGTATLAAATSAGLDEVTVFGGYDASIEGVRRVAAGIQAATMSIDYADFNRVTAELVVAAVQGEPVPEDLYEEIHDNGSEDGVPHVERENAVITQDNIQETIVDTGIYTKDDICSEGIAVDSDFCKS